MGYYTDFSLEIKPNITLKKWDDEIVPLMEKVSGYAFNGFYIGFSGMYISWYSFYDDMIEISKNFPDLLFILSGQGDDKDDFWKIYYKNGKSQDANLRITFDEFDETKLT